MTLKESTVRLSEEQIRYYHQNGFLAIPAITTPEEVEHIREIYDRLFTEKTGRDKGYQFDLAGTDEDDKESVLPQMLRLTQFVPELKDTLFYANAFAVTRQLLGPDVQYWDDHAILKPARIGAETPWHQDQAYWSPQHDYNSVSIWMPLQEATMENGCMQFIPGPEQGILPHHTKDNDPRIHALVVDQIDTSRAVACPIPAGGATIHHCRTLHYTGPNTSDIPRRAYILGFGDPPKERAVPYDFPWNATKKLAAAERREAAAKKEQQNS